MLHELSKHNELRNIYSNFVVCNLIGDSFNDNNYRRNFKRLCEDIILEYKGIHSIRHTFASRLFRRGVDVNTVSSY